MAVATEFDVDLAKELADLRFSDRLNERLQTLMDRNSEGTITDLEMEEFENLIEFNHTMTLFKVKAMLFLGRKPELR